MIVNLLLDAVKREKLKFKGLSMCNHLGNRLDKNTLGLKSIGYWDAIEPQDWGLDWHRNQSIAFYFLESGSMPYAKEDNEIILRPGQLVITNPWEIHKIGNPNAGMGKFYWIIIDLDIKKSHQEWVWPSWINMVYEDILRLTTILKKNEKSILNTNRDIRNCFYQIGKTINNDTNGINASKIRLLVNYILILLLELLDKDNEMPNEKITSGSKNVKLFLDELKNNLSDVWTVQKMAESAGVGITSFIHHCKLITNLTPMRYLMIKRIEYSKKLLLNNKKIKIVEIAYSSGFSTSQYFSIVFKKYEKCSPNSYRHNNTIIQKR